MAMASYDQFPAGLRVLVVDDDVTCLKILDHMLQSCRYRVTTCCQAMVALAILRERRDSFDIVISDVHMPDMSGIKLLELVGLEMDLPVIMMSADGGTTTVMRGIKHGACDYLIKPVRIEELKNIWQHVIRRKWKENRELECSVSTDDSYRNKLVSDDVEYASSANNGADGSLKSYKKKRDDKEYEDDGELDHDDLSSSKKPRVVWSVELHQQFVSAVSKLGLEKAVPKRILELMNVPGLTRENVASHLQQDDMNMQKFRLYLKRISSVPQHQDGLRSSLCGPQDPNMKVSMAGGLDFQALAASGQIPTQTLARMYAEHLGSPSGSLVFPSMNPPVLQASRQGPKCIPTEREITFGQPLFKFQSSIFKQIHPISVACENTSCILQWPSEHHGTTDFIKNHGVENSTLNDNMLMSVLQQKQSYPLPSESHHVINVQPSRLVVPSISSNRMNNGQNALHMTQNSIVIPSQSSCIFRSGNSSIDINPSSSCDSSSIAVEDGLLTSISNNGPFCVGQTLDGDNLNVCVLNGSPPSISSSVSCSARTNSNSSWQLHNSNMNVNPASGLPVELPDLCTQDSEPKLGRQADQRQIKKLGFVGKGTFIPSRFAVDDIESPTNDHSIRNTFISNEGDRGKQELHLDFMDDFQVPTFSSSNFTSVLSK